MICDQCKKSKHALRYSRIYGWICVPCMINLQTKGLELDMASATPMPGPQKKVSFP